MSELNPLILSGQLLDDSKNILSPVDIPEEFRGLTIDQAMELTVRRMHEVMIEKGLIPPA